MTGDPALKRLARAMLTLVHGVYLGLLAALIVAKVLHANDNGDTLWSDPMELWLAGGVAVLLAERAADTMDRAVEKLREVSHG